MRKKMAIFLAVIIALDVIALGVIFFTRNSSRPDISADAAPGADPHSLNDPAGAALKGQLRCGGR